MPALNVFDQDGFGLHSLTDAINKAPYQPMRIGELKLFNERGMRTTSLDVEEQSGRLTLIQTSERGGVAKDALGQNKRTLRTFKAYHLERDAKVYAEEVQNVRAFGTEGDLQAVQDLVNERLAELKQMHEVTLEFHRINAIRGVLLDADGSTLKNLFTEFGVTQQTAGLAFSSSSTNVREGLVAAKRLAEAELGGLVVTSWRAFCSPEWFDAFTAHAKVRDTYAAQEGQSLRRDLRSGFRFADIDFEEYRGSVTRPDSVNGGTATFIDADCAYLVPMVSAATPMFVTRFAPADYEETVNTIGLPYYAKNVPDPSGLNKFRQINTQSNPICLNLRPRAVIKLTKS